MVSTIDFSAQFGGREASLVVLPHFRAMKRAAKDLRLAGFPLRVLAFVLRVDGQVNTYGLSGVGSIEFDRRGEYVSIDIGITIDDRKFLGSSDSANVLTKAILDSPKLLSGSGRDCMDGTDYHELQSTLGTLCAMYHSYLS